MRQLLSDIRWGFEECALGLRALAKEMTVGYVVLIIVGIAFALAVCYL